MTFDPRPSPPHIDRRGQRYHQRDCFLLGRCPIADRQDERDLEFREISGRLELDYPVLWLYKVIGTDEEQLRTAVLEIVSQDDEVTIELSKRSSGGTYVSLNVEVHVTSEEHRKTIYRSLREHRDVRMVL